MRFTAVTLAILLAAAVCSCSGGDGAWQGSSQAGSDASQWAPAASAIPGNREAPDSVR
jgi:hypothetical protein